MGECRVASSGPLRRLRKVAVSANDECVAEVSRYRSDRSGKGRSNRGTISPRL